MIFQEGQGHMLQALGSERGEVNNQYYLETNCGRVKSYAFNQIQSKHVKTIPSKFNPHVAHGVPVQS
jgi:hypothetical protein